MKLFTLALSVCLPLAAAPNVHGVPNFQTVNDSVYRGGQPTGEGFRNLAATGIKTVVDLREDDDRAKDEKKLVKALGMKYINIPMKGMRTPTEKQISHALKALQDEKAAPIFIHCRRGADRTGVVLAVYRVEHDNWSNREALDEARRYGMHWYEVPLMKYVLDYRPRGHSNGVVDLAGDAVDSLKSLPDRVTGIFK